MRAIMDQKQRAAFEAKLLDHKSRVRIPPASLRNAQTQEFVAANVDLQGDMILIALMDEGPKKVVAIRLNAVAATQMAMDILEYSAHIFPGEIQLAPQGEPH